MPQVSTAGRIFHSRLQMVCCFFSGANHSQDKVQLRPVQGGAIFYKVKTFSMRQVITLEFKLNYRQCKNFCITMGGAVLMMDDPEMEEIIARLYYRSMEHLNANDQASIIEVVGMLKSKLSDKNNVAANFLRMGLDGVEQDIKEDMEDDQ